MPAALSSFFHAWNGLIHTVVSQRNMKIHVLSAILVSLVGSGIPLGLSEKVTLIFCVLLVFFAEISNSALEHVVDLAVQEFDEHARIAKDAAAAGVLVLAIGTVVIFAALLAHNWVTVLTHWREILRQLSLGLPFALVAAILLFKPIKKAWMHSVCLLAGLGLLAALSLSSTSRVFTGLLLGLLLVCWSAARRRQSNG